MKLYIAGHKGMVGSSILRALSKEKGFEPLVSDFDLRKKELVDNFFLKNRPDYVILAAAVVGGIYANNSYPTKYYYDNISIQNNIIKACLDNEVKKLLFLGSSCVYPKKCKQPILEDYLMTGPLENTNRAYAIAKIAGLEYCSACNRQYGTNYITAMPCNMYGPNDNYDLKNSHVIPALIRRMHEAKVNKKDKISLWGTGEAFREFLYVDDFAKACLFLLKEEKVPEIINVGSGEEVSIKNVAESIRYVVGYSGKIEWDLNKTINGTPRKILDNSKINKLGWHSETKLGSGLFETYKTFLKHKVKVNHTYY